MGHGDQTGVDRWASAAPLPGTPRGGLRADERRVVQDRLRVLRFGALRQGRSERGRPQMFWANLFARGRLIGDMGRHGACIAAFSLAMLARQACAAGAEKMPVSGSATTVTVDRRIELMGVIQLLSGYALVSYLDSTYKQDTTNFFAACTGHPAVSKFSKLSANGFDFNNVPEAFISVSAPPDLQYRFPMHERGCIPVA